MSCVRSVTKKVSKGRWWRGHASRVRDADRLHDLHVHDAAVLDGLGHLSPTKKRRFVAAPVVDTHWHKTRTMHAAVANLWDP